jgi:O-antigen ligase|tara:strand:+ start:5008 stop:6555 length:1548 start_codon:yes stop_codon:yes gene_type:complete
MNFGKISKNIIIIITEVAAILLMVFNILPRELALFLTGLLIFYFIFSPLEDSLWVFIASIPLFTALPITENFDTLANWRILLIVLFLVLFFKQGIWSKLFKQKFKHYQIEYLTGVFALLACLSLLVADDFWIGAKKIIFLVNAFLLYIIIRNLGAKNKLIFNKIISAMKTAVGIVLGIGLLQLIMVFFVNLHKFWYLWDRNVINVFYGIDLSNLLSYSNTWFSYYSYQLPTLRMFSVFPDSHSFAFFSILALPMFLVSILLFNRKSYRRIRLFGLYSLLILCLLAIIFSGSRGAWVSAAGSLLAILFFTCFKKFRKEPQQIQLVLGSLLLFFLLMPIASAILFLPQYIQSGSEAALENVSLFERARSIVDFVETSVKGRLEIWVRTIDSIAMRPLLGVGIGNFPLVLNEDLSFAKKGSSAHSLYLDFAAEMGIFALIILLIIFWKILKHAWQVFDQSRPGRIKVWIGFFILALIWTFGYNLFDVVLLNDKVLLFFITNLALLYVTKSSLSFHQSS